MLKFSRQIGSPVRQAILIRLSRILDNLALHAMARLAFRAWARAVERERRDQHALKLARTLQS